MPHPFDPSPVFRVNPPPPPAPEPALQAEAKPSFDPTADPVWGSVFTDERPSRSYRVRSEAVWLQARDDYRAGASADAVCERYDLGVSAFRQRARREGWRRSDAEDTSNLSAAYSPAYPPEPEAAPPTDELADLAWRSAAQAIRRGRVYEARAWMRLSQDLRAKVRAEADAKRWAERLAAQEAEEAAQARVGDEAVATAQLHTLHAEDGVQSDAADPWGDEHDGDDEDDEDDEAFDDRLDRPLTDAELRAGQADGSDKIRADVLKQAPERLATLRRGEPP